MKLLTTLCTLEKINNCLDSTKFSCTKFSLCKEFYTLSLSQDPQGFTKLFGTKVLVPNPNANLHAMSMHWLGLGLTHCPLMKVVVVDDQYDGRVALVLRTVIIDVVSCANAFFITIPLMALDKIQAFEQC